MAGIPTSPTNHRDCHDILLHVLGTDLGLYQTIHANNRFRLPGSESRRSNEFAIYKGGILFPLASGNVSLEEDPRRQSPSVLAPDGPTRHNLPWPGGGRRQRL